MGKKVQPRKGLFLIAIFKLIKGALLLLVGIGAFSMMNRDLGAQTANLAAMLHIDADNHYLHKLIVGLTGVDHRKLEEIGVGTFFYATLMFTEGIGLMMRKKWAEYFTIIATSSFVPLEIYELCRRLTFTRLGVLFLNIGIVVYLIYCLAQERRSQEEYQAAEN